MKIAIAGLHHETNTFAVEQNDFPDTVNGTRGKALLNPHSKSFMGGFLQFCSPHPNLPPKGKGLVL